MRNPPGYGSVIKLKGRRRKPFAVRVTAGRHKNAKGQWTTTYKYIAYFDNAKDANICLANLNASNPIPPHTPLIKKLSFKEVYEEWTNFRTSLKKKPSEGTLKNYAVCFRRLESLHYKKMTNITLNDVQAAASAINHLSPKTVGLTKTFLNQVFVYALKHEYCDKNLVELAEWEAADSRGEIHTPFTSKEITLLWQHKQETGVDIILMMIYTGVRIMELLKTEISNINLKEQYMISGEKTEAGRDRIIPIHDSVLPFFKKYYCKDKQYLIETTRGNAYDYDCFVRFIWKPTLKRLNLVHLPHDTRHTFATLADRYHLDDLCLKLVLGHSINDITKGVYTHKLPSELLAEINKLPTDFT